MSVVLQTKNIHKTKISFQEKGRQTRRKEEEMSTSSGATTIPQENGGGAGAVSNTNNQVSEKRDSGGFKESENNEKPSGLVIKWTLFYFVLTNAKRTELWLGEVLFGPFITDRNWSLIST